MGVGFALAGCSKAEFKLSNLTKFNVVLTIDGNVAFNV
jgi:hypothetical protein